VQRPNTVSAVQMANHITKIQQLLNALFVLRNM
jgi:hypothetical protein